MKIFKNIYEVFRETTSRNAFLEEKRRFEARVAELEEDLEEEQTTVEGLQEKNRKMNLQVKEMEVNIPYESCTFVRIIINIDYIFKQSKS